MRYWLGAGLGVGRKRIQSRIAAFGDRLTAVDIEGKPVHVLREDLEELVATPATAAVRLLPGHDQWVLGPGTGPPREALTDEVARLATILDRPCSRPST